MENSKFERVKNLVYEKCLPLIYTDFNKNNIMSSGSGYSGNKIDMSLPPTELLNATSKYDYDNNTFEHFTTFRNLINILNSNKLRMYNMNNMKDSSEYLNATPKKYHKRLEYERESVYVVSGVNSMELNDYEIFNMWEKYGEDGFGAKIKFDLKFNNTFKLDKIFLKRVIYKKLNLTEFISQVEEIEKNENITLEYRDLLTGAGILHKHPQYKLENEIRLALYNQFANDSYLATTDLNNEFCEEYSYNSKKITTYRNIDLNSTDDIINLSISEVELGYKHKTHSELYNLVFGLTYKNHNVTPKISQLENV